MSIEWVIALIVGGTLFLLIVFYNRLVKLRQNRKNAFSDIDVQLKQRSDLVPQLVSTVKGYAAHESKIFEEVTKMRARVNPSSGIAGRAQAEASLGGSLMNLFAVAENYPDLKADGNFQHLQKELSDIENKLAAARRYFNNATNEYNTACEQFPSNIIAGMMSFKQEEFFDVPDSQRESIEKAPELKF
ncbi:MAG: LemA family protein [Rickettsiaceae bacterium]